MNRLLPVRGRDADLAMLSAALEDGLAGSGAVILLEGPPGIGKSRLLAETAETAAGLGYQIAYGGADELDELAPMAWFLATLRAAHPPLVPANVFDGLAERSDQRLHILDRLRGALEQSARDSVVLIALDDLQWTDPATLLAIRVLTVQLASYAIVWLLARRPYPTSSALESAIGQLVAHGARRVVLEPLADDAVASLIEDMVGAAPDATLIDIVAGAGGNPLYLTEFIDSTRRDGALVVTDGAARVVERRIPGDFQSIVASQLGVLSDDARELVEMGAVFGRRFNVRDLADLMGRPAAQLTRPVHEALGAEVIAEEGRDLVFRHDLIREAVYQSLPASLAEALHLDVAHALLAHGNSPAEAAAHLVIGARRGDDETVSLLDRAATEIARTAPAAAADIAVRALDLVDVGSSQWAEAVMRAMMLLSFSGRPREAQDIGRDALATGLDPTTEARILVSMGQALTVVGLYGAAPELADRVLAMPDLPERVRLAALYLLASAGTHAGRDIGPTIEEAWNLATALDSTADRVNLLGRLSYQATRVGDLGEGLAIAREALRLSEEEDTRPFTPRAPRLAIAFTLSLLDQTADAREQLAIVAREGEEIGYPWAVLLAEQARAGLLLCEGHLADAAALAESTWEDARLVDLEPIMPDSLHVLAQVAMRQGDLERAAFYVDHLEQLLDAGAALVSTSVNTVRGRLSFARGDAMRAAQELESAVEHGYLHTLLRNDCLLAPEIVRIARAAGRPGLAERAVDLAAAFASRNPGVRSIAAQAAHAAGLFGDEIELLEQAAADCDAAPRTLQRAIIAEDLAAAHAEHERRDDAIRLLDRALERYSVAEATRDADRVRALLRQLGVRRRTGSTGERPTTGWDALTDAERTVARLAGEALTNRQIADRLYLSPHTVNTHLRHAFTKLGIRSRVELARMIADAGR